MGADSGGGAQFSQCPCLPLLAKIACLYQAIWLKVVFSRGTSTATKGAGQPTALSGEFWKIAGRASFTVPSFG